MRLYVKETTLVIKHTERRVAGVGTLTYRLCEEPGIRGEPTQYGIGIRLRGTHGEEEEYVASITTDRAFASRLWRAIVLGRVTPCTLTDVVVDAISEVIL